MVMVSLAACNRANQANNNDAVRQGVVEYLISKGFDIPKAMTVTVTAVETRGKEADATVSITPTGGDQKAGMTMRYRLEQKGEKWAVVGRSESGGAAHEGAGTPKAAPGAEPPEAAETAGRRAGPLAYGLAAAALVFAGARAAAGWSGAASGAGSDELARHELERLPPRALLIDSVQLLPEQLPASVPVQLLK